MAAIIGMTVVATSLLRLIGRAIERRANPDVRRLADRLESELSHLRERVEVIEELSGRILELEERLDFAERILARGRDSGRVGGGA